MSRCVERKTGHVVAADGIAEKTRRVVQDHLDRLNLNAEATIVSGWCVPRYRPRSDVQTSIVVCTKDNTECLRAAVESIECRNDGQDFELLIVETGAEKPESQALLDELATRHRVLKYDGGGERFNWSRVNNWAARQATGDVVVFLNDDVEVLEPSWLSALTVMAMQPQVGAVGALLEYPDGRLQHAGVIVGAHGWGPWHVLMGARLRQPTDYQGVAYFQRNCLAVTGACLAIRRNLFLELGGFDADKLAVGFSDVDLCVRLHRRGLRNVYLPQARLIHKEGQSRGMRIDAAEAAELATRTGGLVDPYWNANFSRETHIPTISSRRQATGLRFAESVRTLAVFGSETPTKDLPIEPTAIHHLTGCSDRARLKERLQREPFDVVIAVGWDAEAAVKAAADCGLASLWRLPKRPMLDAWFSPAAFQRYARRWKALDLSYQTVFPDLHSRAWLQAGWMRPNARVVERIVAGRFEAELQRRRDRFVVAVESTPGEDESLACLDEALRRLDPKFRELITVVFIDPHALDVNDIATVDVFICQPFTDLRSEAALTALSFGVPIIGSRYLEHADVMHAGVTGLEVPELDPDSLAAALAELLPDVDRRKEMGRQARAWLASRASCHWVDTQWRRLVEEAAELRTGRAGDSGEGDLSGNSGRSGAGQTRGILTTSPNDRS